MNLKLCNLFIQANASKKGKGLISLKLESLNFPSPSCHENDVRVHPRAVKEYFSKTQENEKEFSF